MNENDFWSLISAAKTECPDDPNRLVAWLQHTLEKQSEPEIIDFDRRLHEQMARSYTRDLWAAAYIINGGCSDDGFDYFRAWLIAQGREAFQGALNDPETLLAVAEPEVELEPLLYVAAKAYEARTKRKLSQTVRPGTELTGDEWDEDENMLKEKYPRLFAKFWNPGEAQKPADKEGGLAGAAALLQQLLGKKKPDASDPESLYMQAVFMAMDESPEKLANSAALLTQAADQGHAGAQYLLGACQQEGRGVPRNHAEAARRYRQAADQGHAEACGGLGALYHDGLGVDQDYAEAAKWYQKGAASGAADAEFGLGLLYANGLGVEKNPAESLKWFHRAALNGHDRAALNVGLIYLNGKGVEASAPEAFKWFAQAAEAGSVQARYNLGVLYEKGRGVEQDFAKAASMYQMAADQGNANAMINLGVFYADGRGVAKDEAKAAKLYRQAADAGNLKALSNLGLLYQHGRGVPQDQAEAVRLYRQCAEAGIAVGQFNLGTMYHRGIGVAKDDQEAVRWYRLAAAQNHPSALNNLGDAYEKGYGVEKDYVQAAAWYRQAAERGAGAAHYSLGLFYRDGLGVKPDYQEAEKWLRAAVAKGFDKAGPELEALYAGGHIQRPPPETPAPSQVVPAQPAAESKIVSPPAAAQRALCLRALIRRFEIEVLISGAANHPPAADKINLDALKTEARQINDWLKDEELWLAASDNEKKVLTMNPGSWPAQMLKNASWRAEALGVIGWALGLAEQITPYDQQLAASASVYRWPLLSPSKPLVAGAKLRAEKDILEAREIAESWLWRARTTQIQKEPAKYPPPPGWTYEKIIAMAAEGWEKEGLFKAIKSDYPARGKAYAELTDEAWQELRSIATERLYGLNWLCRYSANWDLVPTGT
jgi:TPR repeat protein